MDEEEEMKKFRLYKEYLENSHSYRGKFIYEFNRLEKEIENYLIKYFQIEGLLGHEFSNIILDRLTFQSKKEAFSSILNKKSIAAGFIKSNNNKYPHAGLIKSITEVQDERNAFAHYFLVPPKTVENTCIALAEFRDSVTIHEYSLKEYISLVATVKDNFIQIKRLTKELPERFPH